MIRSPKTLLYLGLFWLATVPALGQKSADKPFLSDLHVTASDPLYTTYAAQMERSEFTLDEGYHFTFYKPDKPVAFTTDTAGDLFLVFIKDGKRVYRPVEMDQKPVITTSYTDLVTYHYYPFEGIRVDATFMAYSSHQALQDIKVTNQSGQPADLQVIAVLKNDYRTFSQVAFHRNDRAVTFTHQELPDGWVTGHDIPHVSKVRDVLLFSDQPDRMNSYRTFGFETLNLPQQVDMYKKAKHLIGGEIQHQDGKRGRHTPPQSGLMAYINGDRSRIITEKAERWGSADKNITGYGTYGIELGNLPDGNSKSTYTVKYQCNATGEAATIEGHFNDFHSKSTLRRNLKLKKANTVPEPQKLEAQKTNSGKQINLTWDIPENSGDLTYYIYRRDYPGKSYYEKIAEVKNQTTYTDPTETDEILGYVVTAVDADNHMSMPSNEALGVASSSFALDLNHSQPQKNKGENFAKVISMQKKLSLEPGESHSMRLIRAVSRPDNSQSKLIDRARRMLTVDLSAELSYDEELYSNIPRIDFKSDSTKLLYWSAFNLMRQVMLPPEGQLNHNYYVFSREPTWGWGHGGQVFHESLTMLSYALMDPQSAMESQRVYRQVQDSNGYINYRTGSYLNEKINVKGENTTSAPWYAWQNWKVYKITGDKDFLRDMYHSSKKFYEYYTSTRDKDHDGLLEWGGHAVLESVRDAQVAVWDQVGWPTNFEAVGLNSMMVMEEKALSKMAQELGNDDEAQQFSQAARERTDLINKYMWDEETGFYYQIDKKDNDFTYKKKNDLKRKEIVGFLPLWAGVASKEQAKRLIDEHLTNPKEFWRKYGIPSLSASDPYYNPTGYWNGPVWVEWNYLIEDGLLKYGYKKEAKEMVDRISQNMVDRLVKDHNLWEFYSPDDRWGGYHKTYIWAGIINRMLIDLRAESDLEASQKN